MENMKKELDDALALISTIAVAYDAVDAMALAKQKIRKVIADIEEAENNAEQQGH